MCNKVKCEICDKRFMRKNNLSSHILRSHKEITIEEYYLRYISTDSMDGKCHSEGCTNKTNFRSIGKGFYKHCSRKCSLNSKEVKEKAKQTCLNRYGVEFTFQSKEVKERIKKTHLEKYGVEYITQSDEFKEKSKQTCLNKYVSQSDKIKEKKKQTFLNKYGIEYSLQNEYFKEKYKQTMLNIYGVESPLQCEEIREKYKKTCLNKYGYESPIQSEEIKERSKTTCLEKYGVEYVCQVDEIIEKSINSKFEKFFNSLFTSDRLQSKVLPNFTFEDYKGKRYKYSWTCVKCNTIFEDHIDNSHVPRCLKCYPIFTGTSIGEKEIYDFVQQYFPDAESRNRSIISPMELDIYIPSRNFAIEFDGLYWHSELNGKDKNYHLNKTEMCLSKGIQLIHIFEDEWIDNQQIVESIIKSKLGLINNSIYARNCEFKEVENEESNMFLENNHLQESINGKNIGLYHKDELVSILTYGKPRFNKNYDIEILRFCNKLNTIVIGGLSKLLSKLSDNKSIITYVDRRYSNGNGYLKSGFKIINKSNPSYYYIKNNYLHRFNRMCFQKHKLNNLLEEFDPSLTEWQNMQLSGYDRIWDCGNFIMEYKV